MSLYIFLNTNNSNNTNVFWHTDLTDLTDSLLLMFEHEIFLNTNFTRILFGTRLSFFKHTDLTDLTDFELLMFEHEFYE